MNLTIYCDKDGDHIASELKVGTKEYKRFREWLHENKQWGTRGHLSSMKPEYLVKYLEEYKSQQGESHEIAPSLRSFYDWYREANAATREDVLNELKRRLEIE